MSKYRVMFNKKYEDADISKEAADQLANEPGYSVIDLSTGSAVKAPAMLNKIESGWEGVKEGATLGLRDEVAGIADADAQRDRREYRAQAEEQNPGSYAIGHAGGQLMADLGLTAAAVAARQPKVVEAIPFITGAISGAGESDGTAGDRAIGAAVGLGTAAAGGKLAKGLRKGTSLLKEVVSTASPKAGFISKLADFAGIGAKEVTDPGAATVKAAENFAERQGLKAQGKAANEITDRELAAAKASVAPVSMTPEEAVAAAKQTNVLKGEAMVSANKSGLGEVVPGSEGHTSAISEKIQKLLDSKPTKSDIAKDLALRSGTPIALRAGADAVIPPSKYQRPLVPGAPMSDTVTWERQLKAMGLDDGDIANLKAEIMNQNSTPEIRTQNAIDKQREPIPQIDMDQIRSLPEATRMASRNGRLKQLAELWNRAKAAGDAKQVAMLEAQMAELTGIN